MKIPFQKQLRRIASFVKKPEITLIFSAVALVTAALPRISEWIPRPSLTVTLTNSTFDSVTGNMRLNFVLLNDGNRHDVVLVADPVILRDDGFSLNRRNLKTEPSLPMLMAPGEIQILTIQGSWEPDMVSKDSFEHDGKQSSFLGFRTVTMDSDSNHYSYLYPIALVGVPRQFPNSTVTSNAVATRYRAVNVMQNGRVTGHLEDLVEDEDDPVFDPLADSK
jgi:hypothetical protein